MSYDVGIYIQTGEDEDTWTAVVSCGNMTHNVGSMYRLALPGPYLGGGKYGGHGAAGPRGGLPGLSGLPCTEAAPLLREAIAYMHEHRAELRKLNPENGWGNYDTALHFLHKMALACERHTRGTLGVSW